MSEKKPGKKEKTKSIDESTVLDSKAAKERARAEQATLKEGELIAGRYELLEKIGQGGIGQVWRAKDIKLDREVALKRLRYKFSTSFEAYQRFIREAKVLSKMNDPHICNIYDLIEDKGATYISMEFHTGESLAEYMHREKPGFAKKLEIIDGIAKGLVTAHEKGIVHRDLKPSNIMIDDVKILDFGLAKQRLEKGSQPSAILESEPVKTDDGRETVMYSFEDESETGDSGSGSTTDPSASDDVTTVGSLVGTIKYMSPEQAGGEDLDTRSDIFSFGIIMYELFAGEAPFRGESNELLLKIRDAEYVPLAKRKSDCPKALARLIDRALSKKRDYRPSAAEFVEVIKKIRHRFLKKVLPWVAVIVLGAVLSTFLVTRFFFSDVISKAKDLVLLPAEVSSAEGDGQWMRSALPDALRVTLSGSPELAPVGGAELASALEQIPGDVSNSKSYIESLSKYFPDSYFVRTEITEKKDTAGIKIEILDSEGRVVGSAMKDTKNDLFFLADEGSGLIFDILEVEEDDQNLKAFFSDDLETNRLYFKGKELLDKDKPHEAKEYLMQAVARDRNFALAYLHLAQLWETIGYSNRALENLAAAVVNSERLPLHEQFNARSELALLAGFPTQARDICETMLKSMPGDKNLRIKIAEISTEIGDYPEATEVINGLLRDYPDYPFLYSELSTILYSEGKLKEAENAGQQALEMYEKIGNSEMTLKAKNDLAWIKKLLGKMEEAEKLTRDVIDEAGNSHQVREEARAWSQYAYILEAKGDVDGAENASSKALDLFRFIGNKKGEGDAMTDLAWYKLAGGESGKAEKMYRSVLDIWNKTGNKAGQGAVLYYLAWVVYNNGDFREAERLFPQAIDIAYDLGNQQYLAAMHGGLGITKYVLGKLDEAQKMYSKQLQFARETEEPQALSVAYDNIAMLKLELGELDEARKLNAEALKLGRSTKDVYMLATTLTVAGWIEMSEGKDYKKAIGYLDEAVAKLKDLNRKSWLSFALALRGASGGYSGEMSYEEALGKIDEALKIAVKDARMNHLAEIYRIRGDFASAKGQNSAAKTSYQKGLNLARKYKMGHHMKVFRDKLAE